MIPGALEPRPSVRVLEPAVSDEGRVTVARPDFQSAADKLGEERAHGLLDMLRLGLLHLTEFLIRLLRTPASR
jgi:hypothetical protein